MVKSAIEEIPPFEFLAIRFLISAAVLAAVFPRIALFSGRASGIAGLQVGVALAIGYAFQTVGLQRTSATNAGFVTGLFVVFTPLVAALFLRRFPGGRALVAVGLAALGLALMTRFLLLPSILPAGPARGFRVASGDALVLVTAVAFAVHIVLLGKYAPLADARRLAFYQLSVAAVAFTVMAVSFEDLVMPRTGSVWFALMLTSIGASSAGFLVQTWAQSHLTPTATAVTLTMEPVFAGITGFVVLGERLGINEWIGAGMILAAMLLVDVGEIDSRSPAP